jgi:hypothetical protein
MLGERAIGKSLQLNDALFHYFFYGMCKYIRMCVHSQQMQARETSVAICFVGEKKR